MPYSAERLARLKEAGLQLMDYDSHRRAYVGNFTAGILLAHADLLTATLKDAYDARGG